MHPIDTDKIALHLLLLFGTFIMPVLVWTGVASFLRRKSRQPAIVSTPQLNPDPVATK